MSLTSCLHKAKDTMNPDDFDAVLARAQALEDEGVATPVAERQAIQEVLTGVQAELDGIGGGSSDVTQTPAFKAWFGDSKVVDANGKPLTMYHGAKSGGITEFSPATYFSEDAAEASDYSASRAGEGAVYPVFIRIENPYEASDESDDENRSELTSVDEDYAQELAAAGHDGVIARRNGATLWAIPFDPAQIKSAIGNNGDFDHASRDITRSASRENQTETPEFKEWFGDSKMLNKDGTPRVVYHGSVARGVTEFNPDIDPVRVRSGPAGTYFTDSAEHAGNYTLPPRTAGEAKPRRGSITAAYLKLERPLNITAEMKRLQKKGATFMDAKRQALEALDRDLHDGVVFDGNGLNAPEYIVFKAENIKSATGNNGAFDSTSKDITQSAARPMFYSQLQAAIEAIPDRLATMAAPQWKLWLDANAGKLGVKKEEVEWSGVKDYLTVRGKDKVTREEVAAYLADNGVKVQETVLGASNYFEETETGYVVKDRAGRVVSSHKYRDDAINAVSEATRTKYSKYTLPGGQNYRELLITLPEREGLRYTKDNVTRLTQDDPAATQPELFWYFRTPDNVMQIAKSKYGFEAHAKDYILRDKQPEAPAAQNYKSSHWDQKNVLAHIRVDDRTDVDGNKVLFVNEIQSDWGQDGKKKGFKGNAGELPGGWSVHRDDRTDTWHVLSDIGLNEASASTREAAIDNATGNKSLGVPAAPFVGKTEAWVALALKRAIIMAAQGGYDKIAFINGQQSADFYDLSKQIEAVSVSPTGQGEYRIDAELKSGGTKTETNLDAAGVEAMIGKELASKLIAAADARIESTAAMRAASKINDDAEYDRLREARKDLPPTRLTGLDLKIGGEGMRAFYDQLVPQVAREVLKKIGGGKMEEVSITTTEQGADAFEVVLPNGKVVKSTDSRKSAEATAKSFEGATVREINTAARLQPGFTITPAMREKVAGGLPLLSTGRTSTGVNWESPIASKFDDLVYKFQDKQIETKRVIEAITEASGALADDLNVYLNEEMFHGRAAKRTEDFVNLELNPMIQEMADNGMTLADVEEFLHARHAQEANAVIAQRNPNEPSLQDGGSGMTNATAASYLADLTPEDKAKLQAAADKVDAIIRETRKLYVDYELESQDAIDAWDSMFKHYIPLQREDKTASPGIGQGFSIKGKETKGRTGSTRKVVDILANVAMQRERAIVRGEKNRVAKSLIGLATANQNPDFWTVDKVPTERVHNPATGLVEERSDPMYKNRDNAVVAKVKDANGAVREHAVVFNEDDPRALRMAVALKNLDATQLEGLLGASAKITRYFAAVNTQYNPVFGVVNLVRDVQGAMLNLTSTPLANDKLKIAKYTGSALKAVYADLRAVRKGGVASSAWASLWEDFQHVGGQTGYRDMFATSADRGEAIQKALDPTGWMDGKLGKVFTANGALKVPLAQAQKQAGFLFDWLSDYNGAMENGVRLAAYKAGLERGMTREQAASVAKNLTTNFNRKGQVSQQAGAMFAFFNAAIQGTARIGQTLFDMEPGQPKTLRLSATGKKIVYGGILLGSVQAMALAAAGFGDEDPPEFTRERSLIIPTGGKTYISIPMPLGMHIIPNLGRVATEFALSGFKNPVKRSIGLMGMFADAFNPIGNAGLSMQTLAPTALDPLVALTENKDFTGKPIAKTSFNKAIPGHTLGRDTSTAIGEFLSEAINTLSGGNEHVAGVFSPTPDQIDYLIGQVTGGVGREYSKVEQSLKAGVRGEALPTYKIPLVGRFVGNAEGQASEGSAFYANVDKLNEIETEAKGLKEDGKPQEARALLASKPEAYLIAQANMAESQARKLRKSKSELIKAGAPREQVKAIEEKITAVMARLNRSMEQLEKSKD